MKQKLIVFFIVLLLFSITITILLSQNDIEYFILQSITDYDEEPYDLSISSKRFVSNCEPFLKNASQFSIKIDNKTYPQYIALYQNKSLNFECLNKNKDKKLILFWNKFFNDPSFGYGIGASEPFRKHNCPVSNCETTTDKKRLRESDIIVFHMRDPIYKLPNYRNPNQQWVFVLYESPKHSGDFDQYNNMFNTTATYRSNSDYISVYITDSLIEWGNNDEFDANKDFTAGKSEVAAAIISNCNDKSKRLEFIKELNRTVPIHIYGKCGKPCPVNNCKEYIASKYKFYFSFENSVCKDYITEKFFNILKYDIIPVTYGGGPYDRHIPPSGYIDELKFVRPKELADYLLYLDSNKTAYNSYFQWKKFIRFNQNAVTIGTFCEMCIKLNLNYYLGIQKNVIRDFKKLWGDDENCYQVLLK